MFIENTLFTEYKVRHGHYCEKLDDCIIGLRCSLGHKCECA